jgi:hypothetical protein
MTHENPYEPSRAPNIPQPNARHFGLWRLINPEPGNKEWWISWWVGILVFGSLIVGLMLYISFFGSPKFLRNLDPPPTPSDQDNAGSSRVNAAPGAQPAANARFDSASIRPVNDPFASQRQRVAWLLRELERLNAITDPAEWEESLDEMSRIERELAPVSNQFRLGKPATPPRPPLAAVRGEATITLPELDLVLRDVRLDRPPGEVSAIFFSETEITNRIYAIYLAETNQWRDDSLLERISRVGAHSTASPAIHVSQPSSLWRGGVFPRGRDDHPVTFVCIEQAQEFCDWLNSQHTLGGVFRLPTEEEWLLAANGADRNYPWGNEEKSYTGRSTAPVRARPDLRTPDGIYGMWGNVSELVLSRSDGYGGTIRDKLSPRITKWLGESFEEGLVRGKPVRPRQDNWGYTHSRESRSDQWGFRIVFTPDSPGVNPEAE